MLRIEQYKEEWGWNPDWFETPPQEGELWLVSGDEMHPMPVYDQEWVELMLERTGFTLARLREIAAKCRTGEELEDLLLIL